jgi:hypothetical protein
MDQYNSRQRFFQKATLELRELCCIASDVGLILREIKSAG